ncbi:hypothetical protein U9M48_021736 [Paspalum notatum var. saurae]|uniref:WRC domain-containing protein n=1 Tax=Paspalum notatum var. saurae TaxID=547442 RepID=A0AAQ3TK00_PASNO
MRIRRRPPGQPLAYLLPTDPRAAQAPAPGAPRDRRERAAGDRKQEEGTDGLHLHPNAAADLGAPAARRSALLPLLPQDSVMEARGRGSLGAQQQRPADDGGHGHGHSHRSLENGHRNVPESVIKARERVISNDVGRGMAVAVAVAVAAAAAAEARMGGAHNNAMKPEESMGENSSSISVGSVKKPRGPGVLQEGSRCSRKNGRGWRCSQPTLVGYALCQYHLGKGRVRAAAAAGGRSAGQLGRTEHVDKKAPTPAPNKADDGVPPPPTAHGNGMAG